MDHRELAIQHTKNRLIHNPLFWSSFTTVDQLAYTSDLPVELVQEAIDRLVQGVEVVESCDNRGVPVYRLKG